MGWCDDSNSKFYNKLIFFPFNHKAEKLYKTNNIYDIILVLDFNINPIQKNKGSAIFIHIAKIDYKSTAGCIGVKKNVLKKIIAKINNLTRVFIN